MILKWSQSGHRTSGNEPISPDSRSASTTPRKPVSCGNANWHETNRRRIEAQRKKSSRMNLPPDVGPVAGRGRQPELLASLGMLGPTAHLRAWPPTFAKRYKGRLQIRDKGGLFRTDNRLYVGGRDCSRLADNMNTMLSSGIPMVRALELTSTVINNGAASRSRKGRS